MSRGSGEWELKVLNKINQIGRGLVSEGDILVRGSGYRNNSFFLILKFVVILSNNSYNGKSEDSYRMYFLK